MTDTRTFERIRYHYEVETELADRLRNASAEARGRLYREVYDELYRRVPDIPHLSSLGGERARAAGVATLVAFLGPFVAGRRTFLEIGPGDFQLSTAIAQHVERVYAADVTTEVARRVRLPGNVEFIHTDGFDFRLPAGSIDVAFSDQVMEHLHPEDALRQLEAIHALLAPGGTYICITPNRLYGPHDISQYFDPVARGLHLREYSVSEVMSAFRQAGFGRVQAYTVTHQRPIMRVPNLVVTAVEHALDQLPHRIRRGLANSAGLRWILRSRVVGTR
jgi:SAM-dependent methyltransferase